MSVNMSSATSMAYTAIAVNEKQARMKEYTGSSSKKSSVSSSSSTRRRSQRDRQYKDDEDELVTKSFNPELAMQRFFRTTVSAGTILVNAVAMALNPMTSQFVAGSVAVVTSTTVGYNEIFELEDIQTVKGGVNVLRKQFRRVQQENVRKQHMVDDLAAKAIGGEAVKDKLRKVATEQDVDIHNLLSVISEYRRVFQAKRELLRRDVEAEVVRLVMKADSDRSGKFSSQERRRLITSLKNLPSIKVNEERLIQIIKDKNSVWDLLGIIRNLKRHTDVCTFDQPIVIDLDSEDLVEHIAEKARLRNEQQELTRTTSNMSFETVVKMKMAAHRRRVQGHRARSASPDARSKGGSKKRRSTNNRHAQTTPVVVAGSGRRRRCNSLSPDRRSQADDPPGSEPTKVSFATPREFAESVTVKRKEFTERQREKGREFRENVGAKWKRFTQAEGGDGEGGGGGERKTRFAASLAIPHIPNPLQSSAQQQQQKQKPASAPPRYKKSSSTSPARKSSSGSATKSHRRTSSSSPGRRGRSDASTTSDSSGGSKKKKRQTVAVSPSRDIRGRSPKRDPPSSKR